MRRWVDSGRLPGLLVAVVRNDRLAWLETCGYRDVETRRAVEPDTIYRIYSMTKPVTTVAALMLYEEGWFQLDDPVAKFIPAFADTRVFAGGEADTFTTEPLARPVTVHDAHAVVGLSDPPGAPGVDVSGVTLDHIPRCRSL